MLAEFYGNRTDCAIRLEIIMSTADIIVEKGKNGSSSSELQIKITDHLCVVCEEIIMCDVCLV